MTYRVATAEIEETEEENEDGYLVDCVYACCLATCYEVGPIWGTSTASIKRALATLTSECSCGAQFHRAARERVA